MAVKHYVKERLARSGVREIRVVMGSFEFDLGLADGPLAYGVETGEAGA
jgi:hypothetical protein